MEKLCFWVCETFEDEYRSIIATEYLSEVELLTFPCQCCRAGAKTSGFIEQIRQHKGPTEQVVICSRYCPLVVKEDLTDTNIQFHFSDYCFPFVGNEQLIRYMIEKGGYILTNGWLKNWQQNLAINGFDQSSARSFYQESCQELILMDTGIDPDAQDQLASLSTYLGLPHRIVPVGLESLKVYINSIVYQWRLQNKEREYHAALLDIKQQNAEYMALINIIEKITLATGKREVIDRITEMFTLLFGAGRCKYIDLAQKDYECFSELASFNDDASKEYQIFQDRNEILIKVGHQGQIFGILQVGDIFFPQFLHKYTNLAVSIARVSALVILNAQQYEQMERSRDELAYLTYHDTLTGLYNRTYLHSIVEQFEGTSNYTIFVCDLDGMKSVNDSFGHDEGDRYLCTAAQILQQSFRKNDLIMRVGGDEFTIIVADCDELLADKLVARVYDVTNNMNQKQANRLFNLSLSIGYARPDAIDTSFEKCLQLADQQMYQDKEKKKH